MFDSLRNSLKLIGCRTDAIVWSTSEDCNEFVDALRDDLGENSELKVSERFFRNGRFAVAQTLPDFSFLQSELSFVSCSTPY